MALSLYRRHRKECEAGRPEDSRSGEFEESRRGWKRCGCQIHVSGTLGGKFRRRQTGTADWDEAKAIAGQWQAAGQWPGDATTLPDRAPLQVAVQPTEIADPIAPADVTIDLAVSEFLAEHAESAPSTRKKYSIMMKKLKAFAKEKGYVMVHQWGPADVREFRQSWGVAHLTSVKNLSVIKSFFEFALSNEWIVRNPARLVTSRRVRAGDNAQNKGRVPFSDEELARMFEACETLYGKQPIRWSRSMHHRAADPSETVNYRYKWTGQDLADFISVSVYTGLRISDVTTFHISRLLETGECHIRTTKNGNKVYTWIPTWLQERIRARAQRCGPFIFGEHTTKNLDVITDVWRRKLIRLWELCEPWAEKPTPHRFRHTFARILLQRPNVTVRDVAELLGDTEEMVRRHYAAWVSERQERLTSVLKEAFSEKPRPKLVVVAASE